MENLLSKLGWPGATVVLGLLGTIVLLVTVGHVDLKDVALFIGSVGAAYIAWVTALSRKDQAEIKTTVNGKNDALVSNLTSAYAIMAKQADQNGKILAMVMQQVPPNAPLPPALTDPTHPSVLDELDTVHQPTSGAPNGVADTLPIPLVRSP